MLTDLISLLRDRLALIADHAWRDRDSAGHLAALGAFSEKISAWTRENRISLDANLRHYLANSSYQKALAYAEDLTSAERKPC